MLRFSLYGIALLCGVYLIAGTKPWQTEIAARHEAGLPAMLDDYMATGFWWGALFAGILTVALALTMRWWANRRPVPLLAIASPEPDIPRKVFWIGLTVICVLALPSRIARMDFSFWGDEAWAYQDLLHGRTLVKEDGSLDFKRHSWKVTAFYDKGTNNHYLYSLGARFSDAMWKKAANAKPYEFSEVSVRVLPLLAGIGSLIALACLLRQTGFSAAGLAAALVLALHPWHVRYSSEARGYTMLILFLILALIFLIKALDEGKWRWWLGFAAMQFCALYSWKAAIHPVALINVSAAVILLVQRGWRVAGALQLPRWAVANVLTLLAFVPLFLPAVPQISRKLASSIQAKGQMDGAWFQTFWAQLCGGMDWTQSEPDSLFGSVVTITGKYPWFESFVTIVIPVLAVLGLLIVMKNRMDYGLLLVAPLLGALAGFYHFQTTGNEMLKWYLFYTLPFVFAFVAVALTAAGRRWLRFLPVAAFLTLYLLTAGEQLGALVRLPFQDPRGASELTRYGVEGRYHMGKPKVMTVGLYRRSVLYDPRILQKWKGERLRTAALLKEVMRESDQSRLPLRVSVANMGFARETNMDFIALLEDGDYFRPMATFPAGEEYITIRTWEYIPNSVEP